MPSCMEVDFRTQIEVAGYAVGGRMPASAFGTRVAERHDFTGEAFWDASQTFLERLQLDRAGVPAPPPFRYALLPAMFAARAKHGDDWL
jgi:hypothetical protein